MDLDFLSGLLLSLATLAILAYLIVPLVRSHADTFKNIVAREAAPINAHLIGATGEVIAHSDDTEGPMRVRVNLELWPARLSSTDGGSLAVGSSIKVTAVDGAVLVVESGTEAIA